MPIDPGDFVRFEVGTKPPPGVDINANSAMVVTAVSTNERGQMVTCARQGKYVGVYPASTLVEVRG